MPSSLVGVAIACSGNVIISLALTIQKLAHRRQEQEHDQSRRASPQRSPSGGSFGADGAEDSVSDEEDVTSHSSRSKGHDADNEGNGVEEGQYLKSKLWWTGQALITLGEGGNFLSYAFAPASVVAPLGTVALIANCVFAPLILGERFFPREFIGMGLAIIGAVTVVYASNGNNPTLNPDQLWQTIIQLPFVIYTLITIVLASILALLSRSASWGGQYIVIDVGLCCLFGGYTVLSTKALASLLSTMFVSAFRYPLSWLLVAVLVGTSVAQIKYLNKALMRFQSKEVIPTQFVFFSLAAIVGSAVLYQEFRDVPFNQFVNFVFGIATTFLGVYLLTSLSDHSPADHEQHDDDESEHDIGRQVPVRPTHARGPSRTLTVHLPSVHERSPLLIPSDAASRSRAGLRSAPPGQAPGLGSGSGAGIIVPGQDALSPIPSPRYGSVGGGMGMGIAGARLLKRSSTGSFTRVIGSQGGLLLMATPPSSVQRNSGWAGPGPEGHAASQASRSRRGSKAVPPGVEQGSGESA